MQIGSLLTFLSNGQFQVPAVLLESVIRMPGTTVEGYLVIPI